MAVLSFMGAFLVSFGMVYWIRLLLKLGRVIEEKKQIENDIAQIRHETRMIQMDIAQTQAETALMQRHTASIRRHT
jgi:hypothetical protein